MTPRLTCGWLYATARKDSVSYGTAVGALVVAAAFAAYVPAWRAFRVDPIAALRHD